MEAKRGPPWRACLHAPTHTTLCTPCSIVKLVYDLAVKGNCPRCQFYRHEPVPPVRFELSRWV